MNERADRYDGLSRDQLVARLLVAEDALVLSGWVGISHQDTERGKAALQAWMHWAHFVGSDFLGPEQHAYLDQITPQLAAARDTVRAETLAHFFGPIEEHT